MTQTSTASKSMTVGEAILFPLFVVLAFLCLIGAGFAHDAPFAFHASLGCVASLAAGFAILNRYFDRPAGLPPQEINGRPNYNFGPVKFVGRHGGVLGHRRIYGRALIIASQLAWPALNLDLPWTNFGRLAAAAYLGGDLCFRRQRADRDLVLCRAEDLRGSGSPAILRPGSSCSATTSSS